jgi:O-antigen/teichoic acid export membrane protein
VTHTTLSVIFLYFGYGVETIILLNIFTRYSVLFLRYTISKRYVTFRFNLKPNLDKNVLKSTGVFSLLNLTNTLGTKIDVLMISFLASPEAVGIYAVANKFAKEGVQLRNIISTAFFPITIKRFNKNHLEGRKLLFSFLILFLPTLFLCALLFPFIEDMLILFFGDKYSESGMILKYLLFYLVFHFSSLPFTVSLQATHNEKFLLISSTIRAIIKIPLNIILFYKFGLIGIAYASIIVYLVANTFISIVGFITLKRQGYLK